MQMPLEKSLLAAVEEFLSETQVAPSRFGLEAMGDGALVSQLRSGSRSLTLKNADRVLAFIEKARRATAASEVE